MSRPLRILPTAPGGEAGLRAALLAALDGSGPALAPVRAGLEPIPPITAAHAEVPPKVVLAVTTSGSTASARTVLLTRKALVSSATATHARLGGPGQWLLALPSHHIAGLQVLTRSHLARTEPVIADLSGGFTAHAFAEAVARMDGERRYTALVPTQLRRAMATAEGIAALRGLDAVLVGGAAVDPSLAARALDAGVRIVRTYGMTETAGGCVYDGVPLDGVRVRLEDGRVLIRGPVLATGYLGHPELTARTFARRRGTKKWLRTDDLGRIDDGLLHIIGRTDDVIITGGVNVAPPVVEGLLTQLDGIAQACVVGVPDEEWGAMVVAVVVPGAGGVPGLEAIREHVTARLGGPAAPRRLVTVDALPERGPGKLDRRAIARLAAAELGT